MSDQIPPRRPVPIWFTIIAVITAIPALQIPWLLADGGEETYALSLFYPFIIILAAWLAWRCYAQDRIAMSWILIVIAWLCSAAIRLV